MEEVFNESKTLEGEKEDNCIPTIAKAHGKLIAISHRQNNMDEQLNSGWGRDEMEEAGWDNQINEGNQSTVFPRRRPAKC